MGKGWIVVTMVTVAGVALLEATFRFQRWCRIHFPQGVDTGEERPFNEPAPIEAGSPGEDVQ